MIVSVTRAGPILFFLKKKISEDRPLRTSKIALPANSPIRYTLPDRHPRSCDLKSSDNHTLFTMSKIEEPKRFLPPQPLPVAVVRNWFETARKVIRASPIRYCLRPALNRSVVEAIGIEPTTPWLQTRCSPAELRPQSSRRPKNWWAREDLNFRPHAYQARALTN